MGVEEMRIDVAGAVHVEQYKTLWRRDHLARMTLDPTRTYWLFPWDQIIPLFGTYVVEDAQGVAQGFCAFGSYTDRLKIAFLATAPWNHGVGKQHSGVGPGLIVQAIRLSKDVSLGGALTLSSLPGAETFYEERGFVFTGNRDHEDLKIYNLDPAAADHFLSVHKPIGGVPKKEVKP